MSADEAQALEQGLEQAIVVHSRRDCPQCGVGLALKPHATDAGKVECAVCAVPFDCYVCPLRCGRVELVAATLGEVPPGTCGRCPLGDA